MTRLLLLALVIEPSATPAAPMSTVEAAVSPGTLAVFVERGNDASVQERWRTALRHPESSVRAAAARLVHAGGVASLLPDLQDALQVETDAETAAEQIRMLVASKATIPDSELLAAAARMPAVARIAARVLGRKAGVDALGHLRILRAFDPSGEARRVLVSAATNGGQEGMSRAASIALSSEDAVAWETVLAFARGPRGLEEALLVGSLGARAPGIRAATYWYLAEGPAPQGALRFAVEAAPEGGEKGDATEDAAGVDARFAFELLRRARGFSAKENPDWLEKIERGPKAPILPGPVRAIEAHLTAAERQALFKKEALPIGNDAPPPAVETTLDDPPAIRSNVGYWPPGFASSVLAAAGCEAGPAVRILVEIEAADRPRPTRVLGAESASPCAKAAQVLAATSFSSMPPPIHGRELRLLALSPAFVAWLDTGGRPLALVERGSRVRAPEKVKDVPAPKQTKKQRESGPAKVEALIGPGGDVWALHFLGGDRGYAEMALPVAAQWTYASTEIDGAPAPLLATVDVAGP